MLGVTYYQIYLIIINNSEKHNFYITSTHHYSTYFVVISNHLMLHISLFIKKLFPYFCYLSPYFSNYTLTLWNVISLYNLAILFKLIATKSKKSSILFFELGNFMVFLPFKLLEHHHSFVLLGDYNQTNCIY